MKIQETESSQDSAKENDSKPSSASGIGLAIKALSVIISVACIIGSFKVFDSKSGGLMIAAILVILLFGMLCFGIGEICCRLKSIDDKL
jgi:VIT1/CCC1 family predicted Fe2+/Mn2+ transporter